MGTQKHHLCPSRTVGLQGRGCAGAVVSSCRCVNLEAVSAVAVLELLGVSVWLPLTSVHGIPRAQLLAHPMAKSFFSLAWPDLYNPPASDTSPVLLRELQTQQGLISHVEETFSLQQLCSQALCSELGCSKHWQIPTSHCGSLCPSIHPRWALFQPRHSVSMGSLSLRCFFHLELSNGAPGCALSHSAWGTTEALTHSRGHTALSGHCFSGRAPGRAPPCAPDAGGLPPTLRASRSTSLPSRTDEIFPFHGHLLSL